MPSSRKVEDLIFLLKVDQKAEQVIELPFLITLEKQGCSSEINRLHTWKIKWYVYLLFLNSTYFYSLLE